MEAKNFLAYGHVRWLLVLVLVGLVTALGSYTLLTLKQTDYLNLGPTTISVQGEGEVLAKPDVGHFTFGLEERANEAVEAQNQSAQKMNDMLAYLQSAGVEEKDIKTTNYNLQPQYRYEERACAFGSYCPPGERILDGYMVMQTVSVKVRDLDAAGSLISGVGERGATNISGLSFTIDDETVLKSEAREAAIEDAKEKADRLAKNLGVKLVKMVGYWEDEGGPIYAGYGGDMMESVMTKSAVEPDFAVGENSVMSRVNLTFVVE